ncbi:hypothetical protein KEJ32_00665, partial [Candidatus Bathyarchaeota archaeon]|nr:hypothetical protein [Candidatus Bathyarchaeota archaeon]
MPLKKRVEKAITEVNAKRAFEHIKNLASFGSRVAGTEGDLKSIKYMSEQFVKAGLKVEYDVFNAPSFIEKEAKVLLSYPSKKEIKVRAMLYSVSTSSEGVKGELVYANLCKEEDFMKIDAKEKIVMFSRTKDKDAFYEEVANAAKNGAKAVIMVDYNPWIFTATMESGYFDIKKRF